MKPRIRRVFYRDSELGRLCHGTGLVIGEDHWVTWFPPETSSELHGFIWISETCNHVKDSIAAWNRNGLQGLGELSRHPRLSHS